MRLRRSTPGDFWMFSASPGRSQPCQCESDRRTKRSIGQPYSEQLAMKLNVLAKCLAERRKASPPEGTCVGLEPSATAGARKDVRDYRNLRMVAQLGSTQGSPQERPPRSHPSGFRDLEGVVSFFPPNLFHRAARNRHPDSRYGDREQAPPIQARLSGLSPNGRRKSSGMWP